ncbi:MAG: HAMP domain-containing histidine kinase [Clostridiales bacterium]|nr:HAMP domain-containing histidine kinase [Clostridiales bacterium]
MRFSLKICFCTVLIVAVLFAVTGHVMTQQSFDAALSFRVDRAIADYSSLASAIGAEIYGLTLIYNNTTELMYAEVLARAIETQAPGTACAIYNTGNRLIASVNGSFPSRLSFENMGPRRFAWRLTRGPGGRTMMDTAGSVSIGGYSYYLAVRYDADELFAARQEMARSVTLWHIMTIAVCMVAMLLFSLRITRSMRGLGRAVARIGSGHYEERAQVNALDEIGDLAYSFNKMAAAIEQKVGALEGYAKQQEDFVASFSHELKTPMTSIIGYADMLRSAALDEEDAFTAANFIFSEGKRLEALSLKLMDLVVLDKNEYTLTRGYAKQVIGHVTAVVTPMLEQHRLTLETSVEQQHILYEKDLILTLLTNLIDNARKASSPGGKIQLVGKKQKHRYRITVRDFGIGIPPEEVSRITEAFFMVDKSRARAQHGAGLGLAIGNKIAQLLGSSLHFESEVGVGTTVWFDLPLAR